MEAKKKRKKKVHFFSFFLSFHPFNMSMFAEKKLEMIAHAIHATWICDMALILVIFGVDC
jgi:hypothetical protein